MSGVVPAHEEASNGDELLITDGNHATSREWKENKHGKNPFTFNISKDTPSLIAINTEEHMRS